MGKCPLYVNMHLNTFVEIPDRLDVFFNLICVKQCNLKHYVVATPDGKSLSIKIDTSKVVQANEAYTNDQLFNCRWTAMVGI